MIVNDMSTVQVVLAASGVRFSACTLVHRVCYILLFSYSSIFCTILYTLIIMLCNTACFIIAKELPTAMQDWVVLKQNLIFHEYGSGHFIAD